MEGSYAGVDWASDKHDVLVADAAGEKLLSATFAHDEQGLRSLCRALVRLKVRLVAVERPDGLMVERLLDAGLRVLALHPNQVKAARDRFRVSGGKSDGFDAFVLCELARTDHHRFRVLEPDSDATKAIRALTRGREDLVGARTALVNQLRAELERFWPGPLGLFSDLHSRISLAFLERYPSPADARGLGEARLRAFLARERYSGRRTAAQLLAKLRAAPAGSVGERELVTRRGLVSGLVAMITQLNDQIAELEREIATAIREHPDGAIFTSLFKGAVLTAAELLAEIGDCRGRYPTRDTLAGDAGQAAVAIESGKRKAACFRWGCNKRLRQAFHTLADSSRHHNPWAQDLYAQAIARGHDHPPARYAPSAELGHASCGSAGKTASRMTQPATAPCSDTSLSPSPPRRAPCPTQPPPSGWPAPPSLEGRPAGPSAQRLTATRRPLNRPLDAGNAKGLDTGRLPWPEQRLGGRDLASAVARDSSGTAQARRGRCSLGGCGSRTVTPASRGWLLVSA
ncbi:MAG TPA: IS110 family transposase [Solirubrobacteraceae bacterium]|nr:IS110 family transposase [Solirubrobacteraceae bacterium]